MRFEDGDLAKVLRNNPDLRMANQDVKVPPPLEHAEQCELMQLAELYRAQRPALGLLFAIPNGGKRDPVTAMRMVREGVRAGVPDLLCPVARGGYHGMFVEMKRRGNTPTVEQAQWHASLREQGYYVIVAYSAEEAFNALCAYLDMT